MVESMWISMRGELCGRHLTRVFKTACCALVVLLPFCWLSWADHVVDANGRRAEILAEGAEGLRVRYPDQGTEGSAKMQLLPRSEIRRWIPGIASMLHRVDLRYAGAALLIHLGTTFLVGWRWSLLITGLVSRVRTWDAVVWQIQSAAADVIGAGQIGMEACRLALAGKRTGNYAGSVTVQIGERCLGLLALGVLVIVGVCFFSNHLPPEVMVVRKYAVVFVVLCTIVGGTVLVLTRNIETSAVGTILNSRFGLFIQRMAVAASMIAQRPSLAGRALLLSFVIHLTVVANHYLLSRGLGLGIGPIPFLVTVPIVSLALALPITIAGIGVFEGTMATRRNVKTRNALTPRVPRSCWAR